MQVPQDHYDIPSNTVAISSFILSCRYLIIALRSTSRPLDGDLPPFATPLTQFVSIVSVRLGALYSIISSAIKATAMKVNLRVPLTAGT